MNTSRITREQSTATLSNGLVLCSIFAAATYLDTPAGTPRDRADFPSVQRISTLFGVDRTVTSKFSPPTSFQALAHQSTMALKSRALTDISRDHFPLTIGKLVFTKGVSTIRSSPSTRNNVLRTTFPFAPAGARSMLPYLAAASFKAPRFTTTPLIRHLLKHRPD